MFQQNNLDQHLEEKNKKIKELIIRNEVLDKETKKFIEELKVTTEQLTAFIEKQENFTEKNWKELQKEKNKIEQRLHTDLISMRNPLEVKKTYAERKIDQHWLFVR